MGIVTDILDRAEELEDARRPFYKAWRDTVKYVLPMGDRHFEINLRMVDKFTLGPKSEERGREIFDATSVTAIDRLTSGLESLTTPASEKWHGLEKSDPFAVEASDEEQEWFDQYRDFLFKTRYNPKAGFALANQSAIRGTSALGTSVFLVEESLGADSRQVPFKYRFIPLSENLLAVNDQGQVDTNYRRMTMTARQMVQRWGDKNHSKVKEAADNDKKKEDRFDIIHAVFPRAERGGSGNTNRDSAFASINIDVTNRHLIGESGFFEFPYVVYYWQQNPDTAYGESPVMMALAEIKSLNLLAKNSLRSSARFARPAWAVADGVTTALQINDNPGKVNHGLVNANGQQLFRELAPSQPPSFIEGIMNVKREQIRETLFVNLFQILVNNPQMTATEALIRANEKGELLGPAGSKIQTGLAHMLDRETAILARKGAFESGSPLEPPESLQGESFGTRFTAPIDRLRRGNELVGIQRTYEFAGQIAGFDPTVLDRLDADKALEHAQQINGAPRDIFKTDDEVEAARAAREQQEAQARALAATQQAADAASKGVPVIQEGVDLLNQFNEANATEQ